MSGQETPVAPARRPARRRRGRRLRAAVLPVAVAVASVGVVAAALLTDPQADPATTLPAAATLPVQERRTVLVCPGPENAVAPVGGSTDDQAAAATQVTSVATASGPAGAAAASLQLRQVDLSGASALQAQAAAAATPASGGTPVAASARADLREPGAVLAEPRAGAAPARIASAATQVTRWSRPADAGPDTPFTTRGLSARTCQPAVSRAWLVGGATTAGHAARLLLSNPTSAAASVDVRLLGPAGAITPDGGKQVPVRAGQTVALYLESLAPALQSTVVEVSTTAGRVTATLHDVVVRGVTAGGTDDVGPAASPRQLQVVPGVVVSAEADEAPAPGDDEDSEDDEDSDQASPTGTASAGSTDPAAPVTVSSPGATVVRVGVPGSRPAAVQIQLVGPDGPVRLPGGAVSVPAGGVRDVLVRDVPDGDYAAVVQANVPVVAGAVSGRTRAGGQAAGTSAGYGRDVPPAEFAWTAAGTEIGPGALLAVPDVARVRLTVTAPQAAGRLVYRVVDADGRLGDPTAVAVRARHATTVDLPAGTSGVVLAATGRLFAALVLTDADGAGPLQSVIPFVSQPGGGVAARQARQDARLGGDD